jgi:mono/diheme cytochrome c family protein
MRVKQIMLGFALAAAALSLSPAGAAELRYGRNGVPTTLPDLGPVGDGRRIFVEYNCYGCHGGTARGEFGPSLVGETLDSVDEAITYGEIYGGMPPFRKYLNQKDIQNVAAYLATLGTKKEPTWFDWWEPNPTE